jgi:excisionase family DNA binding protein
MKGIDSLSLSILWGKESPQFLTIDEAARVLNVDREYVVRLVIEGRLSAYGIGESSILSEDDVASFKAARDAQRREGLRELTRVTEELGGYALDYEVYIRKV